MQWRKAFRALREKAGGAVPIGSGSGWLNVSSTAWSPEAWQADSHRSVDTSLSNAAVFACVTLIASDIGKLRPRLVELRDGIWIEASSPAFSPVLRKPNNFQNHIQFKEAWITSKLMRGNTYILKERDARGVVVAMYPLDPSRVTPLVTPDGAVYYQLSEDNLAGIDAPQVIVPASEIIHDRMHCLFHPLVGLSPLFAAAATAGQGLNIQKNSTAFFGNNSLPGGILTAPGNISPDNAKRLKEHWDTNYTGANAGKVAVLGDGLKFEAMRMSAVESQMIDQLNVSAKMICSAFHVPPFMIGMGEEPTYSNGETRTSHYYSQCLQSHIEHMEESLDDGLSLLGSPKSGSILGVELDLSGLMRMDTKSQIEALAAGVKGSIMTPNEARRTINLPKVPGGDTVFMQQQNYSLEALSNQAIPDPAGAAEPAVEPDEKPVEEPKETVEDTAKAVEVRVSKLLEQHSAELSQIHEPQAKAVEALQSKVDELAALVIAKQAEPQPDPQAAIDRAVEAVQARALALLEQQAAEAERVKSEAADQARIHAEKAAADQAIEAARIAQEIEAQESKARELAEAERKSAADRAEQADLLMQQLTKAVATLVQERQAVADASEALDQQQQAFDNSQEMAEALMRKFTGASA